MKTQSQADLREALKVALQDAKAMFEDGLLNEQEYVDLKQHELRKYKAALASASAVPEHADFFTPPRQPQSNLRPVQEPEMNEERTASHMQPRDTNDAKRGCCRDHEPAREVNVDNKRTRSHESETNAEHDSSLPSDEGRGSASEKDQCRLQDHDFLSPRSRTIGDENAIDVDRDVYERLRTPPIFRRRSAMARRIVVLSREDLDALQSPD